MTAPLVAPAPELAVYDGHPVTWTGWEPGLLTSMRFHYDMRCDLCKVDAYPDPACWGLVQRAGEGPALRELAASRCTACGRVLVIALADPGWSWLWGGPGSPLPVGVERREPPPKPKAPPAPRARGPRTRPSVVQERPAAPPAGAGARQAAREALAAHLAARRAPLNTADIPC